MYANYPNLIFTHKYTNRNITSCPIFHVNQKKKKRHQIYSTLEEKENHIEIAIKKPGDLAQWLQA